MSDAYTPPRPERKATVRWGQRELSRISLAVIVLLVVTGGFAGYRVFKNFKAQRDIVIARENMLAIYTALSLYAKDWDGRLPPADQWTDAVLGYLSAPPNKPGGKEAFLHGPGDGEDVGYVYNNRAAGYNLEPTDDKNDRQKEVAPNRLVLLIEKTGAGPNAHTDILPQGSSEGEKSLSEQASFPHHADDADNATTVVMFANGTPATMIRRDFK